MGRDGEGHLPRHQATNDQNFTLPLRRKKRRSERGWRVLLMEIHWNILIRHQHRRFHCWGGLGEDALLGIRRSMLSSNENDSFSINEGVFGGRLWMKRMQQSNELSENESLNLNAPMLCEQDQCPVLQPPKRQKQMHCPSANVSKGLEVKEINISIDIS